MYSMIKIFYFKYYWEGVYFKEYRFNIGYNLGIIES